MKGTERNRISIWPDGGRDMDAGGVYICREQRRYL